MLHVLLALAMLRPLPPALPGAVREASLRHGVPELVLLRIAWRESGWRLRGHVLGMQGGPGGLAEIHAGARRLAVLRRLLGSWRRAVCAWRWGRADCRGRSGRADPTGYVAWVMEDGP